ncbi:MAG: Trp operon repressor [Chlamydiales bacterium]|nr:Trp operon repressor [Chlamydiales bacterium]
MEKNEWELVLELFLKAKNKERMDQLLHLFLTITEREFLFDRFRIIQELLLSNQPQREIAKELGVSIAKITVGSNELKKIDRDLKKYLLKHLGNKNAE